ncbi:low molecular weight protein-tyrosine-phosphatase [uncultured Arcticibacterium sp.]|uniref:low molecular weight protein-tyrosine-phosphatase n=1 Tax=uncultured Arcticibacterium sp. TaxID=2173042 RepID=UPI0030F54B81
MVKVLFVCLGNICRSPLGEASFREIVRRRGLSDFFEVDSAGTAGYHIGKTPDRRSLEVLEENNLVTSHVGRKLSEEDFDVFDHIAVMDEANFEYVHNMYHKAKNMPPPAEKLFLIRDFDPEVRGIQEVPDPYYESHKAFQEVYKILWRSNEALLEHLMEMHNIVEPSDEEE